jgi:pimeloyl-ACP methyl ester carboxylesterase
MSLTVKRMTAAGAGLLRKAIPARGWRRYATGGIVVALAAFGTVTAATTQPAQAARTTQASPTTRTAVDSAQASSCKTPASPYLAGFKQGQVAIPGDSIHYVIGGSGPALVLLAGWPITWWEFHTIMPTLAKSYTVIALDLPGLGNSTFPTSGGFTTADGAVAIHAAVDALGYETENISILGHDLGANVAYSYARLYPHTVNRVMVLESALNGYGLEGLYGAAFHFLLNMQPSPTPEKIINNVASSDAYLTYMYSFAVKPGAITTQDRKIWDGDYACPLNREAGYDYYRAFAQNAAWDTKTNKTKIGTLMAAMGGQDSFGNFVAQSFGNVDKHVHTIIAPGSGHYIPEEDPRFLAECASLFFSPVPPAKAPKGYATCLP